MNKGYVILQVLLSLVLTFVLWGNGLSLWLAFSIPPCVILFATLQFIQEQGRLPFSKRSEE